MTPERRRAIAALIVWSPVPQEGALIDCLAEIDRLAGQLDTLREEVASLRERLTVSERRAVREGRA